MSAKTTPVINLSFIYKLEREMVKKKKRKFVSRIDLVTLNRPSYGHSFKHDMTADPSSVVREPENDINNEMGIMITRIVYSYDPFDINRVFRKYFMSKESFDKFSLWFDNVVSGYCFNHPNCGCDYGIPHDMLGGKDE